MSKVNLNVMIIILLSNHSDEYDVSHDDKMKMKQNNWKKFMIKMSNQEYGNISFMSKRSGLGKK